jgi:catalase
MSKELPLTSESGAPVDDNQNSQTAGVHGPVLLQDHYLVEKLAHFNRERIPERVVHARGSAAYGHFVVTNEMSNYTRAHVFGEVGRSTETFLRCSTVAGSRGAPEAARDPRGFALKFYTQEGNYDLVGNNTPVFFIKDPLKFPDFIHSQKPDPFTHRQEPNNVWDFFSLSPEATHQFTILFSDRGIPASYRHMNGFGSHTFQWVNDKGEQVYVKYHFKTNQGIKNLTSQEAADVAGLDPESHNSDLVEAIERGEFPSWTMSVQIMPVNEASTYKVNPFDVTKVWNHADYPLIEVGTLTLDRNADNYFAEVEQSTFSPANFVAGIGPSPDKMLQGRLFGYGDAHRYRVGPNSAQLPVNSPKATTAQNYSRDGFMASGANGGRSVNYEPNSLNGPQETREPLYAGLPSDGPSGSYERDQHSGDDFAQAGDLYRLQKPEAQERLINNIADSLSQVTIDGVIDRSIGHFEKADPDWGSRLRAAVALRQSKKS